MYHVLVVKPVRTNHCGTLTLALSSIRNISVNSERNSTRSRVERRFYAEKGKVELLLSVKPRSFCFFVFFPVFRRVLAPSVHPPPSFPFTIPIQNKFCSGNHSQKSNISLFRSGYAKMRIFN